MLDISYRNIGFFPFLRRFGCGKANTKICKKNKESEKK